VKKLAASEKCTAVTQAFLTLSEVLGHTDMLMRDGRVAANEDGSGRVRFEAT
jgi:hypothetical protein